MTDRDSLPIHHYSGEDLSGADEGDNDQRHLKPATNEVAASTKATTRRNREREAGIDMLQRDPTRFYCSPLCGTQCREDDTCIAVNALHMLHDNRRDDILAYMIMCCTSYSVGMRVQAVCLDCLHAFRVGDGVLASAI
ncbi:hypothetical protein Dimus_013595 [Dionaea muscipula]